MWKCLAIELHELCDISTCKNSSIHVPLFNIYHYYLSQYLSLTQLVYVSLTNEISVVHVMTFTKKGERFTEYSTEYPVPLEQ